MPFPDSNQESQFQEVYEEITGFPPGGYRPKGFPDGQPFDSNEEDLRKVFLSGYKYGLLSTLQKFAKSVSKRLKEKGK